MKQDSTGMELIAIPIVGATIFGIGALVLSSLRKAGRRSPSTRDPKGNPCA